MLIETSTKVSPYISYTSKLGWSPDAKMQKIIKINANLTPSFLVVNKTDRKNEFSTSSSGKQDKENIPKRETFFV